MPKNKEKKVLNRLSFNQVNMLVDYLKPFSTFYLRNNVEKLKNGTEKKDGIGYYLFNELKLTPTESQLASHLASIFYYAGVWDKDPKRRPISFAHKNDYDWQNLIEQLYLQSLEED